MSSVLWFFEPLFNTLILTRARLRSLIPPHALLCLLPETLNEKEDHKAPFKLVADERTTTRPPGIAPPFSCPFRVLRGRVRMLPSFALLVN